MDRKNPFDDIERMFEQFTSQFGQLEGEMGQQVAVDVADLGDSYEVTADLPGFEEGDIDVTLPDARTLRLGASSEHEAEESDREFVRRERRSQQYRRTVSLPSAVAADGAEARYDNGVLTVTLPKQEAAEGTDIPVN